MSEMDQIVTRAIPRWSVLKNDFKLIHFSNGSQDLFDLSQDPEEAQPLDPANFTEIRDELQSIAVAEGVTQPADGYSVQHVDWAGSDGDSTANANNWSGYHPIQDLWASVIANASSSDSVIEFQNQRFLGLQVDGSNGSQTLRVQPGGHLVARNELRINSNARVHLDNSSLESARWLDVKASGSLTGNGDVNGQLYNWGVIAPGLPSDLDPPPAPNQNVDTGIVPAIDFNFAGVQDDSPLSATSQLSEYLNLSLGLSYGPGVFPRNAANAGNEFNASGWRGASLQEAIDADDYLLFYVQPVPGIEVLVDTVSVRLWRNGNGAAKSYGTLVSPNGFTTADAIGLWEDFFVSDDGDANNPSDGIGIQHQVVLTAQNEQTIWERDRLEVRFYGWDPSGPTSLGNTHINQVLMTAQFRSFDGGVITVDQTGQLRLSGDFFHQSGALLNLEVAGTDKQ